MIVSMADEHERRAALRAWLADQEAEYGPIPADVLQAVRDEWLGDARPAVERAAPPDAPPHVFLG